MNRIKLHVVSFVLGGMAGLVMVIAIMVSQEAKDPSAMAAGPAPQMGKTSYKVYFPLDDRARDAHKRVANPRTRWTVTDEDQGLVIFVKEGKRTRTLQGPRELHRLYDEVPARGKVPYRFDSLEEIPSSQISGSVRPRDLFRAKDGTTVEYKGVKYAGVTFTY